MKISELLKKLRPSWVPSDADRPGDAVDALASSTGLSDGLGWGAVSAPTNWVPSQQDERPH